MVTQPPSEHVLAAAEAADIGLWVWDLRSRRAWYSAAFKRQLGYGPEEFGETVETFSSHIHPEDLPRVLKAMADILERGAPVDLELRMRRHDGTWATMHVRGRPEPPGLNTHCVRGAATEVAAAGVAGAGVAAAGVAPASADELDRARADLQRQNSELQRARAEAVAAAFSKSSFLANMSHEIRTPMTAILGFADMLAEPGLTEDEQRGVVSSIRRNSEHLLKIINDILDISKIEAGGMTVEPLSCDPSELVAEVAEFMRPRAAACGLDLHVQIVDSTPAAIRTDPTRLRQILTNLIGNAIKFTEHGGIHITVEPVPAGHTLPPRRDPEPTDAPIALQRLRIMVADTGIGMTQSQVERLFRPFSQADVSTTRRFGGTGLGLTISRRLARLLGGDIHVSSTMGGGSTFTVEVDTETPSSSLLSTMRSSDSALAEGSAGASADRPTIPAGEPAAIAPLPRGAHGAAGAFGARGASDTRARDLSRPLRVLLAEDGEDNQRLLSFHLKRGGIAPTVAENGRVACELAEAAAKSGKPFDAILMDMQMPELDGYQATRRLRERGYTGPVVALTAHAMQGDRERCMAAGCDEYLTKPIDGTLLIAKIQEQIERHAPR